MGKYDLGLARKIISGAAKLTEKEEAAALEKLVAARAAELSPKDTKIVNDAYGVLKSNENVRGTQVLNSENRNQTATNIMNSQRVVTEPSVPTKVEQSFMDKIRAADNKDRAVEGFQNSQDMERAERIKNSNLQTVPDEVTKVAPEATVESEAALAKPVVENFKPRIPSAPLAAPSTGLSQFAPGIAEAADKLKQYIPDFQDLTFAKSMALKQGVAKKVVHLISQPMMSNPHVPQYAKDDYSEGASAVVGNAIDPVNWLGGAAGNAAVGAASSAYDIYSGSKKPQTSYVDEDPINNPTQSFKVGK